MSAKRSWDVRRDSGGAPPARPKRSSLKERRKREQRIFLAIALAITALLLAAAVWLIWQPFVRVSSVEASGVDAEAIQAIATEELWGTYFFVLPRNSIFFYPEGEIRARILEARPAVAAVSVSRASFTSLSVKGIERTAALRWCGIRASEPSMCYEADAEGFLFRESPVAQGEEELIVYAQTEAEAPDDGTPLRAHVVGAADLPDILRFVKAVRLLGVSVVSVEIRGDEADLYAKSGTRITYIIGKEEQAAALAASAFPSLDFVSGLLEYVDLRFEGKAYIKRHGDPNA